MDGEAGWCVLGACSDAANRATPDEPAGTEVRHQRGGDALNGPCGHYELAVTNISRLLIHGFGVPWWRTPRDQAAQPRCCAAYVVVDLCDSNGRHDRYSPHPLNAVPKLTVRVDSLHRSSPGRTGRSPPRCRCPGHRPGQARDTGPRTPTHPSTAVPDRERPGTGTYGVSWPRPKDEGPRPSVVAPDRSAPGRSRCSRSPRKHRLAPPSRAPSLSSY